MSKIAIDIALIPSEEIMDKAIEINRSVPDDPIRLNKIDCLPHITLCMGIIDETDLKDVEDVVVDIAKNTRKLNLIVKSIGGEHSWFVLDRGVDLMALHEKLMKGLSKYLSFEANPSMFFSHETISSTTLYWVSNYRDKASFENFSPHISLAKGELKVKKLEIAFTAQKIVICYLGNYSTCRRILFSVDL